jgi:hypothetical protein
MFRSRVFLSYSTAQKNEMGVAGVDLHFNKIFTEASLLKREELSSCFVSSNDLRKRVT